MDDNGRYIDLGTDARTAPTREMWEAMQAVELGASPFKGHEALERLLAEACRLTGQAAALLLPSCTMANLVAMMAHAERGDQVVLEESSHIAWSEGWGMASIAGLYPKPVKGERGCIGMEALLDAIGQARFSHRPRTTLLCLENTHNAGGGAVLPVSYTEQTISAMRELGIAVHLDGARIFNAAVSLGMPVLQLTASYDSVAFNLNKALGAPEGAILCGSADFVRKASRIARSLGGDSQHKAELIAAAGLIGLREAPETIAADHRRALTFASAAHGIAGIEADPQAVCTNIVMLDVSGTGMTASQILRRLRAGGVAAYLYDERTLRFTFHRQINDEDTMVAARRLEEIVSWGGAEGTNDTARAGQID